MCVCVSVQEVNFIQRKHAIKSWVDEISKSFLLKSQKQGFYRINLYTLLLLFFIIITMLFDFRNIIIFMALHEVI